MSDASESCNATKIAELEKRFEREIRHQEQAVAIATQELRERFASVNEFRGQLRDQASTFLPRSEYQVAYSHIDKRLMDLKESQDRAEGRYMILALLSVIIASVIGAVMGWFLK